MGTDLQSSSRVMPKYLRWLGGLLVVAVLWILFPPFSIVRLDENGQMPSSVDDVEFDVADFVSGFWQDVLEPSFDEATELSSLLAAVKGDPGNSRNVHGRRAGEGAMVYYYAKGEATVVELKGRKAILEVDGEQVRLVIAPPVFGNTVRDGTGLLGVNDFDGLEEFNEVSAVLNQKVETEVMASLKGSVQVGARLSFVGCSKAPESVGDGPLLEFIPFRVEIAK